MQLSDKGKRFAAIPVLAGLAAGYGPITIRYPSVIKELKGSAAKRQFYNRPPPIEVWEPFNREIEVALFLGD